MKFGINLFILVFFFSPKENETVIHINKLFLNLPTSFVIIIKA